jgi:triosephosphate isomerase (TIM)
MPISNRRRLVAGNWKLNKTIKDSVDLAKELTRNLPTSISCEVLVAPVFTALYAVRGELAKGAIRLAAQDSYWENHGAFTGEVSAFLLRDVGCDYVIVGHSERRQLFGETNSSINKKIKAVIANDMIAIVCVGESHAQHDSGETMDVVLSQVSETLQGIESAALSRIVIAYEPIWAIGTSMTATPQDAQEVHFAIRERLTKLFGREPAQTVRILYGGSVTPYNAANLLAQPDIDGALVGGASLVADLFLGIVKAAG